MKAASRIALLVALVFTLAFAALGDEPKWNTDLAKAIKQAKKTKRMILVDFYADW